MKIPLYVILILLANLIYGQTEDNANKAVTDSFIINYNNDDHKAIFSMFAEVMKKALPKKEAKKFFQGLKSRAGKITQREFLKYEKHSYASYKTKFEKAVMSVNISIDNNSKINGIFVRPYTEEVNTDNVVNDINVESSLSRGQAKTIYDNMKLLPNNSQISIALIKEGEVSYAGIKIENDTISSISNEGKVFEIGSISKIFTSTILSNLVISGIIKLDDDINHYLKTPIKNNIKISFLELANHTSGLPRLPTNLDLAKVNPDNPYKEYHERQLLEYLAEDVQLTNKGKVQYSNLGVGLLGFTLSKIENSTYENLLQQQIFSKFGMINSTTDIGRKKELLVKGLNSDGKEVLNWEFSVLAGAGAILSTAEDLSLFVLSQFDETNNELKLTRNKTTGLNEEMDIGLGWHILKSKSKNLWYWHNGGTGGYTSSLVLDEQSKNAVVVLSNVSAFNPNMKGIEKICFDLMRSIEDK